MVDSHRITEQASLLSKRAYADVVDEDHSQLSKARAIIIERVAVGNAIIGEKKWSRLIRLPWKKISRQMLKNSSNGRPIRSDSPFSLTIGVRDPDMRRQLWRQAKRDLAGADPRVAT